MVIKAILPHYVFASFSIWQMVWCRRSYAAANYPRTHLTLLFWGTPPGWSILIVLFLWEKKNLQNFERFFPLEGRQKKKFKHFWKVFFTVSYRKKTFFMCVCVCKKSFSPSAAPGASTSFLLLPSKKRYKIWELARCAAPTLELFYELYRRPDPKTEKFQRGVLKRAFIGKGCLACLKFCFLAFLGGGISHVKKLLELRIIHV